jgi:hypothetical protein
MAVPGKFTPVQRNVPQGAPPPSKGNIPALPIFAVILYAVYLGVMIIGPTFITKLADELDPMIPPLWRLIGAGVLFVALTLIIVYTLMAKPRSAQEGPPPVTKPAGSAPAVRVPPPSMSTVPSKFKPVSAPQPEKKEGVQKTEPRKIEDESAKAQLIAYPLEVEGGIFGDTYIQLSPKKTLKLRSMVIEPEYLS